jgi:hypothetical protein
MNFQPILDEINAEIRPLLELFVAKTGLSVS